MLTWPQYWQHRTARSGNPLSPFDAAEELLARRMARSRFIDFAQYVDDLYKPDPFHEKLGEAFDKVVSGEIKRLIINAPPQHGKCLSRGSLVLMADGALLPIEDIPLSSMVISANCNYNSVTRTVVHTMQNGVKPVLKITLQSGRVIRCTHNHPLLTIFGWEQAGGLKVGDHIASFAKLPMPQGEPLPYGFAALMGYLTGDGSYADGSVEITSIDPEIVEHLTLIAHTHGWVVRPTNKYGYRISKPKLTRHDGTSARERIREYMPAAKSINKRVPDCIFKANSDDLKAFIAAYFNCDATVNDKREGLVEFYSVSEGLLRDVQHLLTRFGIYSRLRVKRGRYKGELHLSWRLIVSGRDALVFAKEIPAIGERGRQLRAMAEKFADKWRNPEHDGIPVGWQQYLKKTLWWHRINTGVRADKNYKYGTARSVIMQIADAEDNDELRKLCNPSIVWERIVDIQDDGEEPTYDIEVDETHNFVVDNVIVHNSAATSEKFPAFWLGKRPNDSVIIASYGAELAEEKSRKVRDLVESDAYTNLFGRRATQDASPVEINAASRAVYKWHLAAPYRGGVRSGGVEGPITGFPSKLGIIDDPVKDMKEAQSPTIRESVWTWYRSVFRTRVNEGGAIIIIMTRWAEQDLVGKLLADAEDNEWTVLRFTALAETQEERDRNNQFLRLPVGLPDPLGREPGEPLAPGRFSREELLKIRRDVGPIIWGALYDSVPRQREGGMFKRDWFSKTVTAIPR